MLFINEQGKYKKKKKKYEEKEEKKKFIFPLALIYEKEEKLEHFRSHNIKHNESYFNM